MEPAKNLNGPKLTLVGLVIAAGPFYLWQLLQLAARGGLPIDEVPVDTGFALVLLLALMMQGGFIIGGIIFVLGCVKTWMFYGSLPQRAKRLFAGTIVAAVVLSGLAGWLWYRMNKVPEPTQREHYCRQLYPSSATDEMARGYVKCLQDESAAGAAPQGAEGELKVRPPNPL